MYVEEKALGEAKTFSQVMNEAADILRDRGKVSGMFTSFDGRVCTWAAVHMAATGDSFEVVQKKVLDIQRNDAHWRLEAWIHKSVSPAGSICYQNNNSTQEEMVSLLRRAAVEA